MDVAAKTPRSAAERVRQRLLRPADGRAVAALADLVRGAQQPYAAFVGEMAQAIREEVPDVDAIPGVARRFDAVCEAHVDTVLVLFEAPEIASLDAFAEGATAFARECAHWDVPADSVLRVFQTGAELVWHWWADRIARDVTDARLRADVTALCGHLLMSHTSAGAKLIVAVYRDEREARLIGVSWQQREVVVDLLHNPGGKSSSEVSARIGYDLHAWHLGFAVWARTDPTDLVALEVQARRWAEAAGDASPLLVPGDSGTIWGWLPALGLRGDDLPDAPSADAQIAVGQPAKGLAGFIDTHREAVATQRLVLATGSEDAVSRHSQLAVAALLNDDVVELRRFVVRALGGLAESTVRGERLRQTVRTYLATGESTRDVAETLHFHRNTIQNRLELAATLRGRPLSEDRLPLALALEVAKTYGERVLTPSGDGGHDAHLGGAENV